MALTCDACGYRSNEVKSGAGVSAKGTRTTLHLTDPSDLSRDILKVRSHADQSPVGLSEVQNWLFYTGS